MFKRNPVTLGLPALLVSLLVVAQVIAQSNRPPSGPSGIPPGATDTGLGGINAVSGVVTSATGQRFEQRISVRLRTMTKGDRIASTDDQGKFFFTNIPAGDYLVVIDKEKEFVERVLRSEMVTAAYGSTTSFQVFNEFDDQLQRAIELLPQAKQLALEGARSRANAAKRDALNK